MNTEMHRLIYWSLWCIIERILLRVIDRGVFMRISYKKLWILLIEREIPKMVFRQATELSPGTMSKLNKNEDVALSVLLRICDYLDCDIGDICEAVRVKK